MNNEYKYGGAEEVADRLMWESNISHDEIVAALINALRRISALEDSVEELRARRRAAE